MTPDQLIEGWLAGHTRVVLRELPNEDFPEGGPCPEEHGELLGPDVDLDDYSTQALREQDMWLVQVDERHRQHADDGLRGGVPADQILWETQQEENTE